MSKFLPAVLLGTALLFGITEYDYPVRAGTCVATTSCGQQPIQFVPGQRITVEIVNLAGSVVQLQQVSSTAPLSISPGQVYSFVRGGRTDPNFSVVLWDAMGRSINVNLLKPQTRTLRIEVRPGGRSLGDRSIYLRDDGRVAVF